VAFRVGVALGRSVGRGFGVGVGGGRGRGRAIGSATVGPGGVDVKFSGILEFPSGVTAEISSGFTTDGRILEAVGSGGSIQLRDPWNALPASIVRNGVLTELEHEDLYRLEIDDASAAVRGGSKPLLGGADALGQARTIEALYRSAETHAEVNL
jgi:xylose dehydrogenase (NAD/NADP)